MKLTSKLFIFLCLVAFTAFSQQQTPKALTAKYLDSLYTEKPKDILDAATIYLDSMVNSDHCFKVIFNKAHNKFIAFYAVEKKSKSYKTLKMEYGAHFRTFKKIPKPKGKFKAIGYTVCGMLINEQWVFDGEEYIRLAGKDMLDVQNEYMFQLLSERGFFKQGTFKEDKDFWTREGFTIEKTEDKKKVASMVLHSQSAKEKRDKLKVNFKLEKQAEIKTDSIWSILNAKDSLHYNSRFQNDEEEDVYYVLYNESRTRVLIPLIYKDKKNQMYLSYFTYQPSDTTRSIYIWKAYPERRIEKIQDQKMDIIKDIRKFSINWLWSKQNFIDDEEFWKNNFGMSNLEELKK